MEAKFDLDASLRYFDNLQMEFLSFVLRAQLFTQPEICKKNKDIAEMKKKKVLSIANKLKVLSLFECDHVYDIYIKKFLRDGYFPAMQYRSETDPIKYWDNLAIMKEGQIVYYNGIPCEIVANNPSTKMVAVKSNSCKVTLSLNSQERDAQKFWRPYSCFALKIYIPDRLDL